MRVILASAVTPTIPMGLFAIGDALERAGHEVRIVHVEIERARDPAFRLSTLVNRDGARLVGLAVHWAHQSLATIEVAAEVKRGAPGAFVVAGGLTASTYPSEVLACAPGFDAVIRGEGEGPIVSLARALEAEAPDLASVPNLVWRGAHVGAAASIGAPLRGRRTLPLLTPSAAQQATLGVVTNAIGYVALPESLADLRYARADLLSKRADYLALDLFPGRLTPPVFLLCTGRGCTVNCTACGGGRESHADLAGRDRALFRPIEAVLADLESASRQGFRSFYVCNDPKPNGPYFFELFERMRASGLAARLELGFGCWALPSRAFLEAARRAFARVFLEISPETGSESLRRRVRGFFYSNADLEARLQDVEALDITAELYFGFPAAGETEDELRATRAYANRLARRHSERIGVNVLALSTDPASPMVKDPAGHGIELRARGFAGILRALEEDRALYPPAGRPPWFQNYLHHRPETLTPRALAVAGVAAVTEAALRARRPRLLGGAIDALGGEARFEPFLEAALAPLLDALEAERAREGRLSVDDAEVARRGVIALCDALLNQVGRAFPGLADVARVARAKEALLSRIAASARPGAEGPPGSGRRDAAGPNLGTAWFKGAPLEATARAAAPGALAGTVSRPRVLVARPTERAVIERLPPGEADPRVGPPLDPAARGTPPGERVRLLLAVDAHGREWGLEASAEAERVIELCDGHRTPAEVVRALSAEGVDGGDAWIEELMTYGAIEAR